MKMLTPRRRRIAVVAVVIAVVVGLIAGWPIAAIAAPSLTLFVYGLLLFRRVQAWHRYHDARSLREMLGHVALFIVAIGAAVSSALAIAQAGTIDLRRAAAGIAFGSFLAAGVLFFMFRGPIGPVNGDGK